MMVNDSRSGFGIASVVWVAVSRSLMVAEYYTGGDEIFPDTP
ncbi:hypothetical protein [Marinobacter segnicrescens]